MVTEFHNAIRERNGFLEVQLRDVIYWVCLILAGGTFIWDRLSTSVQSRDVVNNQLASVVLSVSQIKESVAALSETVKAIDEKGTTGQRAFSKLQEEKNLEQDRRINNIEQTLSQMVPVVTKMETRVDFIAKYVEEIGKAKK